MATFHFRFRDVLRHRQAIEDHAQRDLAKWLRQRLILQTQLKSMQETVVGSRQELTEGLSGRVDMDRVARFARHSGQVTLRAHEIVARLTELEKQIGEARQRLLEATKARRALDLLRQRDFAQWRHRLHRHEAIDLDELSTQRFLRAASLGAKA